MRTRGPTIEPFGERAFIVVFGESINLATNRRVHALAAAIRADADAGIPWGRPVPAYESVLVPFDPDALEADRAEARLAVLAGASEAGPAALAVAGDGDAGVLPIFEIPTRYGGPDGPDLAEVAVLTGHTAAQVVELHAGRVYSVFMLGFSPGFAYLGSLPTALEVPRRDTPRTEVPAGSVGIAARQTAVYPTASPGGWKLIGRTDVVLWDPRTDPPTPLAPGRRVRFVPVDA